MNELHQMSPPKFREVIIPIAGHKARARIPMRVRPLGSRRIAQVGVSEKKLQFPASGPHDWQG